MNLGLLIADGVATLLVLAILILDLAGARITRSPGTRRAAPPGPGQRLAGAGACLACGTVFLTGLARRRHWPGQRYHDMLGYLRPVMLAAMVLIIAGAAVRVRSRRRPAR